MLSPRLCPLRFDFYRNWGSVRTVLVTWGLFVLVGSGGVAVPAGAQSLHGQIETVNADRIRIELVDSLNVAAGIEGWVVQQRTVGERTVQNTLALIVVERVERPAEGPWVAVARIWRDSEDIEVGTGVRFAVVERRSALSVRSDPAGAEVFVDGEPMGSTPLQRSIGAGTYKVRLEKEGYTPTVVALDVGPGDEAEITRTLQEATGTLVVNTLPESATVRLGGQKLGQTPLRTEVRSGTDTLSVRREGHLSVERTVDIQPDEETRLNLVLRRPISVQLADRQGKPIENVRLHREEDQLVVQYDLVGGSDLYEVKVLLSTDGGTAFQALPEAVAGHVGEGITPGRGRQIVWRVLEDFPKGIPGSGNRLQVMTEAEGGGGIFWVLGSAIVAGGGATAAALLGVFEGGSTDGEPDLPNEPPSPPE